MTSPSANPQADPRERRLRAVVLGVCALVGLSALWGIVDASWGEPRVWGLLGFEVVSIVTAGLGVLVGLGRPREAPGLAAACIGATIFAAATLGRFSAIVTRAAGTVSEGQAVRLLVRDPMFEGRLGAALLLGAIAVCLALGSDRAAWKKLGVGCVLLVPVVVALGWLIGPGRDWLLAPVESSGGMVRVVIALVGGVGLMIAASIAVHQVIGAFEARLPSPGGPGPAPGRKATGPTPNKSA